MVCPVALPFGDDKLFYFWFVVRVGELEVVYVFFFFSVIKASLDSSSVISLPYVPMWLGIRACKIVFFSLEFMYF